MSSWDFFIVGFGWVKLSALSMTVATTIGFPLLLVRFFLLAVLPDDLDLLSKSSVYRPLSNFTHV
jgi:hypothetical protein